MSLCDVTSILELRGLLLGHLSSDLSSLAGNCSILFFFRGYLLGIFQVVCAIVRFEEKVSVLLNCGLLWESRGCGNLPAYRATTPECGFPPEARAEKDLTMHVLHFAGNWRAIPWCGDENAGKQIQFISGEDLRKSHQIYPEHAHHWHAGITPFPSLRFPPLFWPHPVSSHPVIVWVLFSHNKTEMARSW